jgi:nucleoside phosphorylase
VPNLLLVTATPTESKAVFATFKTATQKEPKPLSKGQLAYHELGEVNGVCVFLVQSEMSSSTLGGSQQTVQKGIEALSPIAVIMVGIAFGMDSQKQRIGDILISKQLKPYELQKVGTRGKGKYNVTSRSSKVDASPSLLNRLRVSENYWDEKRAKLEVGVVLSGEKLIDNIDFRDRLKAIEPEAIGGEMEGTGLYNSCQDKKTDWILVKAICDWADGNKKEDKENKQATAAKNAADFVLFTLQKVQLEGASPVPVADHFPKSPESPDAGYHQRYYVQRYEEDRAIPNLKQAGTPIILTGPEKFGKSNLISYLCHWAQTNLPKPQHRIVSIQMPPIAKELSDKDVANLIAAELIEAAGGSNRWIDADVLPAQMLTDILVKKILPGFDYVILAIDGLESLWGHSFQNPFLLMIKQWNNNARRAPWSSLRLILGLSAGPELFYQGLAGTPIGNLTDIQLQDFDDKQALQLATCYQLPWTLDDIKRLMELVGGHPRLLRISTFRASLPNGPSLQEIIESQPNNGIFKEYLSSLVERLPRNELKEVLRTLLQAPETPVSEEDYRYLKYAGILLKEGDKYKIRYKLYENYFREHFDVRQR